MTTFRIASDFHLEFFEQVKSHYANNGRDANDKLFLPVMEGEATQTLILAGDILTRKGIQTFDDRSPTYKMDALFDALSKRFQNVIVIAGNHEFYGSEYADTLSVLHAYYAQWDNFVFLQNELVLCDDVLVFGTTLWTNFANGNPVAMLAARNGMPDFGSGEYGMNHGIKYGGENFTPETSIIQHNYAMDSLQDFLDRTDYKKKIVVTHHAPSGQSTAPQFIGSALNAAFSSNLEMFLMNQGNFVPQFWIHGHMHNHSDYMLGETRVIANPYGYYAENPGYIKDLTIQL